MTASSTHRRSENPTSSERDANGRRRRVRSIVVCGASVRSLAESAFRSGFRPLCIDFFGDTDLRALLQRRRSRMVATIDNFAQLPEVIRTIRSGIPLLWAGGLENHLSVLREVAKSRTVIGPDLNVVEHLKNPFELTRLLTNSGLRTPKVSRSLQDSDRMWLRKSIDSSGGMGVALSSNIQSGPHDASEGVTYFQEYIDGVPMSATFVGSHAGCRMIGISLQLSGWPSLGASGFQYCGNAGPVAVPENIERDIRNAGQAVYALGLRGVFGIDFVLRQGRTWFLEVNPRITASHIIYEHSDSGLNLFREHLVALGVVPELSRKRNTKATAFTLRAVIWNQKRLHSRVTLHREKTWQITKRLRLTDIPESSENTSHGTPLCSVDVTGESLQDVGAELGRMEKHPKHRGLCDWSTFRTAIQNLWARFEANLFEERRRQHPRRSN